MAFDLNSISTGRSAGALGMLIAGRNKDGKSTTAASAPDCVVMPIEDGLCNLRHVPAFPKIETLSDFYSALGSLIEGDHDYKHVSIDTLDALEVLVQAKVAKDNGWADVSQAPYGQGWVAAANEWSAGVLAGFDALKAKGINVICLAQVQIGRVENPSTDSYDAYQLRLHKKVSGLTLDWCDVAGFIDHRIATRQVDAGFGNKKTKAVGTGERVLRLEPSPAHFAGSRFGLKDCPLDWAQFSAALQAAQNNEVTA